MKVMQVIYKMLRPRTTCAGTQSSYETLLRARQKFDTVSRKQDVVERLLVETLKEVNGQQHGS